MLETYCRPLYQKFFVDPVASLLLNYRFLKPYFISLLALLAGIGCFLALYLQQRYWAAGLLVLSGYFDTLDGTLARLQACQSPQGAVIDIVIDRIVEFLIIFGLFFLMVPSQVFLLFLMMGVSWICVTTFLVVGIFTENNSTKSFHYSPGLVERAEAFLFFLLIVLLPTWFVYLAWVYIILVFITAAVRVCEFLIR